MAIIGFTTASQSSKCACVCVCTGSFVAGERVHKKKIAAEKAKEKSFVGRKQKKQKQNTRQNTQPRQEQKKGQDTRTRTTAVSNKLAAALAAACYGVAMHGGCDGSPTGGDSDQRFTRVSTTGSDSRRTPPSPSPKPSWTVPCSSRACRAADACCPLVTCRPPSACDGSSDNAACKGESILSSASSPSPPSL